jgi:hypothetical protein
LDIGYSVLDIGYSELRLLPPDLTYRNFKVAEKVGTPFRVYHFLISNPGDRLKPAPT